MKVYVIATSPEIGAISNNLFYIDRLEADEMCVEMNDIYKEVNKCEEMPWSVYDAEIIIKVSV